MAVEDYLESEVAVATAATAALLSPRVRGVIRKGLVYGTAGVMTAGDAALSVAKGAGKGVQRVAGRGSDTSRASSGPSAGTRSRSSARARSGRSGSGSRRSPSRTSRSSAGS